MQKWKNLLSKRKKNKSDSKEKAVAHPGTRSRSKNKAGKPSVQSSDFQETHEESKDYLRVKDAESYYKREESPPASRWAVLSAGGKSRTRRRKSAPVFRVRGAARRPRSRVRRNRRVGGLQGNFVHSEPSSRNVSPVRVSRTCM